MPLDARTIFSDLNLQEFGSTSDKGWYKFDNPLDGSGKPSAARVNFRISMVKDHRLKYTKPLYRYLMDAFEYSYSEAVAIVGTPPEEKVTDYAPVKRETILPEGYKSLTDGAGVLAKRARNYLIKRGFDIQELDMRGFGYVEKPDSKYFGYIIIPVHNDNKLAFFLARDYIGNTPKYLNEGANRQGVLYNEEALLTGGKVYVTEGWSDAETMGNGIALLGPKMDRGQRLKVMKGVTTGAVKELIFVADKGFYAEMYDNAMPLIDHIPVKVLSLDTAFGGTDANSVGKEGVLAIEEDTEYLSHRNKYKLYRKHAKPVNTH